MLWVICQLFYIAVLVILLRAHSLVLYFLCAHLAFHILHVLCPLPTQRADLREGAGVAHPLPLLRWLLTLYSRNLLYCLICILRTSHYVIGWSKAFLVFAFKICLRHQSVTPFLRGAPLRESPESAPATVCSFKGTVSRNLSNFKQWELPMFVTFEIILERYLFHTKLWFCHSQVIS